MKRHVIILAILLLLLSSVMAVIHILPLLFARSEQVVLVPVHTAAPHFSFAFRSTRREPVPFVTPPKREALNAPALNTSALNGEGLYTTSSHRVTVIGGGPNGPQMQSSETHTSSTTNSYPALYSFASPLLVTSARPHYSVPFAAAEVSGGVTTEEASIMPRRVIDNPGDHPGYDEEDPFMTPITDGVNFLFFAAFVFILTKKFAHIGKKQYFCSGKGSL